MNVDYARDLDLNLLRVFVAVADQGSVTAAASRLYLTQPAVSAALKRLNDAVGARLFARQGRGLALTHRGRRLLAAVRPHLGALIDATRELEPFDPATSTRTFTLGLSDATESWLLPALLRDLETRAPQMRFIAVPVQFRTVGPALAERRVNLAITVAGELPPNVERRPLFRGRFVCLFDPRHADIKRRVSERAYFAHEHVIVSYNADLRGIIEDLFERRRRVRCSVASFGAVGAVVDGSALVATVPRLVADQILELRPHLSTGTLPAAVRPSGADIELMWPAADSDDPAAGFVRERIIELSGSRRRR